MNEKQIPERLQGYFDNPQAMSNFDRQQVIYQLGTAESKVAELERKVEELGTTICLQQLQFHEAESTMRGQAAIIERMRGALEQIERHYLAGTEWDLDQIGMVVSAALHPQPADEPK